MTGARERRVLEAAAKFRMDTEETAEASVETDTSLQQDDNSDNPALPWDTEAGADTDRDRPLSFFDSPEG